MRVRIRPIRRRAWMIPVVAFGLLAGGWAVWDGVEASRRQVDWVALNPAFAGATFVNDDQVCAMCHDQAAETFAHTAHARAFLSATNATGSCESCHGPRSGHLEDPTGALAWDTLTAAQQSAVCLQCHEGGSRMGWTHGPHLASDVSCSSCHTVMEARSERALLATAQVAESCYQCHADVRASMFKASHHPVREGRMDCASCHNVHGSTPALLTRITATETCVSCHADKRGPFLWEHAPVRESCANCHEPHGSSNRGLLASKDPFLCLQCHSYGGHVNLPRYNRVSTPVGSGCVNCHIAPHGSNHPSGAKLTR